jgi:hypothetical protein
VGGRKRDRLARELCLRHEVVCAGFEGVPDRLQRGVNSVRSRPCYHLPCIHQFSHCEESVFTEREGDLERNALAGHTKDLASVSIKFVCFPSTSFLRCFQPQGRNQRYAQPPVKWVPLPSRASSSNSPLRRMKRESVLSYNAQHPDMPDRLQKVICLKGFCGAWNLSTVNVSDTRAFLSNVHVSRQILTRPLSLPICTTFRKSQQKCLCGMQWRLGDLLVTTNRI